jgi:hypothetical protein
MVIRHTGSFEEFRLLPKSRPFVLFHAYQFLLRLSNFVLIPLQGVPLVSCKTCAKQQDFEPMLKSVLFDKLVDILLKFRTGGSSWSNTVNERQERVVNPAEVNNVTHVLSARPTFLQTWSHAPYVQRADVLRAFSQRPVASALVVTTESLCECRACYFVRLNESLGPLSLSDAVATLDIKLNDVDDSRILSNVLVLVS